MVRLPTLAAVLLVITLVCACDQAASASSGAASADAVPSASAAPSASSSASPLPSASSGVLGGSPGPTAHGSLIGGGPLASLVVERMARTPFSARIEIQTTSLTKTDTASADLTATETGAISGQDLDLSIEGVSGTTTLRSRLIVVGDKVYASDRGGPWQVGSRGQMQFVVDAILLEVRRTVNADQLADLGVETLEGQSVHHLTLTAPVTIHDQLNGDLVFDVFDLWVLEDGSPVLRKTQMHGSKGSLTSSATSLTRYAGFGTAIEITPPRLPASPQPSVRPARP